MIVCHNPFATRFVRPSKMPFLCDASTVTSAVNAFRENNFIAQIVGPHGCGKSTLCRSIARDLQNKFDEVQFLTIRGNGKTIERSIAGKRNTGARRLTVVDGIGRLSFIQQQLLVNNSRFNDRRSGLLVTSHKPVRFLKTILRIKPTLEQLQRVVEHLAPELYLPPNLLVETFRQSQGDIRESLMLLFDWFENSAQDVVPCVATKLLAR